jgi:hypothetical protein
MDENRSRTSRTAAVTLTGIDFEARVIVVQDGQKTGDKEDD